MGNGCKFDADLKLIYMYHQDGDWSPLSEPKAELPLYSAGGDKQQSCFQSRGEEQLRLPNLTHQ